MKFMDRIRCRMGKHRFPVTMVGITERSDTRGIRTLAGVRCRCGELVVMQILDWRKGVGATRALKREVKRG